MQKFAGLDGDLETAHFVVCLPFPPHVLLHVLEDLDVGVRGNRYFLGLEMKYCVLVSQFALRGMRGIFILELGLDSLTAERLHRGVGTLATWRSGDYFLRS